MRLTEWRGEHAAVVEHHENYIDKLAAYEDTGYSPLEIKSLEGEWNAMRKVVDSYRKAEEQGLLVRLPCKVRDTVYYLTGNPSMVSGRNFNRVESTKAIGFYWDEKGLQICLYMPHGNHGTYGYFGDTIFLTREEAEAALKGGQDDGTA